MTLPEDFSSWEHLQNVLVKVQNRIVRQEFSDVGGDDWLPDISTSRASLRVACTLEDNDTSTMTLIRLFLYYIILRKCRDLIHPVYGQILPALQVSVAFKPQISLFFLEDDADTEGFDPVTAEFSLRLMDEDSKTITQSTINAIANRINSKFGHGSGYILHKGKDVASYTDKKRGIQTWYFARSKSSAEEFFRDLISIEGSSFDPKYFNYKENGNPTGSFPTIPDSIHILGKTYKLNRQRPIASVRFQYALLHIHGQKHCVPLVDRTGIYLDAIHGI